MLRALRPFGWLVAWPVAAVAAAQSAGPDGFGYVSSSIPLAFIDISATGIDAGLNGEDDSGVLAMLGFDFDLYGVPVSVLGISTNGYLTATSSIAVFGNTCVPAQGSPNAGIFPFWDDLTLENHGAIHYQTAGPPGARVFVAQWEDVAAFGDVNASLTFQVKIFELDSHIEFHYASMNAPLYDETGGTTTVGIEDEAGGVGLSIGCNQTGLVGSGTAIRISHPLPIIDVPPLAIRGTSFTVQGIGDPAVVHLTAFSTSDGPIGPFPVLGGLALDLGFPFTIVGSGLTHPATGTFASFMIGVPPTAPCGLVGYFQTITIGSFGPIGNVKKSNSAFTVVGDPEQSVQGGIAAVGKGDHYTFSGQMGETVTVEHCRLDNTGFGFGTMDPYVCLISPSGVEEAADDDSAGVCEVPGPFGAARIEDHVLAETGLYKIIATSFQGGGAEIGTYRLSLSGCAGQNLTLVLDEGPVCPSSLTGSAGKVGDGEQ
jgi:hypothetical protein